MKFIQRYELIVLVLAAACASETKTSPPPARSVDEKSTPGQPKTAVPSNPSRKTPKPLPETAAAEESAPAAAARNEAVLWRYRDTDEPKAKSAPKCLWRTGGKTFSIFTVESENSIEDEDEVMVSELTVAVVAEIEGAPNTRVRLVEETILQMMGTMELRDLTVRCRIDDKNRLLLSRETYDAYSGNLPGSILRNLFVFKEGAYKLESAGTWKAESLADWGKLPRWGEFSDNKPRWSKAPEKQVERLQRLAGPSAKQGSVVRFDGEVYLLIPGEKETTGFVSLSDLPDAACRSDKRAERPATWWYFEGINPVALQLTDTSADFWQYDASRGCLASRVAFEAAHMEKGAEELLNLRLLYQDPEMVTREKDSASDGIEYPGSWKNTKHKFPDKHLVSRDASDMSASHLIEHAGVRPDDADMYRISWNGVSVFRGKQPIVNYSFSMDTDHVGVMTYVEWYNYFAAGLTVYRNKSGLIFYAITSQNSQLGDTSGESGHYIVFTQNSAGKTIKVAERTWQESEWAGKTAGEIDTYIDDRELRRYYETDFGTIEHLIQKKLKTIDCPLDDALASKLRCPTVTKRNGVEWTFRPRDGAEIQLYRSGKL